MLDKNNNLHSPPLTIAMHMSFGWQCFPVLFRLLTSVLSVLINMSSVMIGCINIYSITAITDVSCKIAKAYCLLAIC